MSNSTINQPLSCILAIVLFSISMEYAKVSPSCPELICVSHCCCFFLFLFASTSYPELTFYTNWLCRCSLFFSYVVCLFPISVCVAHLSWAGLWVGPDAVVALLSTNSLQCWDTSVWPAHIWCWDRTLCCSSWSLVNDVALIIGVDFYR